MLILRAKKVALNAVMTTPKRRILTFVFTVLCFKKSLLISYNPILNCFVQCTKIT